MIKEMPLGLSIVGKFNGYLYFLRKKTKKQNKKKHHKKQNKKPNNPSYPLFLSEKAESLQVGVI